MKYSSFLMSLPFLQNRSSITCSDDLLGVVRITKEMIENTCEVIGKGIKQTGREGEAKKEVELENKFSWMQREESFKKTRTSNDTR